MIKNLIKIISLLACIVMLFCCCKDVVLIEEYYSFTDDNNQVVTLYSKPQKVAVLLSSFAEIWSLSGGKVDITVGESVERGLCENTVLLVDNGAGKTINAELLASYKPDFIIGSVDIAGHSQAYGVLKNSGAPFCLMRVENFNDYLRVLKIFCEINENTEAYKKYGEDLQIKIKALIEDAKNKKPSKVMFIRSGSSESSLKAKASSEHFAAAMLSELGAVNIADSAEILLDGLSHEEIIMQNPKYIFVSLMGNEKAAKKLVNETLKKPEWQVIDAIKNNRVIFLEKELFQYKPNQRFLKAYSFLNKALYGEN